MSEPGQTTVEQGRDWARAGLSVVFYFLFGAGLAIFTLLAAISARLVPLGEGSKPLHSEGWTSFGPMADRRRAVCAYGYGRKAVPMGSPADHQSLA